MSSVTMGKIMREHVVAPSKVFGSKSTQMTSILEHELKGKRTPFAGFYTNTPTDLAAIAGQETYGYHAAFRVDTTAADDLRLCLSQMEAALGADSATPEQRDLVAKPVPPPPNFDALAASVPLSFGFLDFVRSDVPCVFVEADVLLFLAPAPFTTCVQVDRDPFTLAPACGDVGFENVIVRVSKEVRITMIDGSKIPLFDAPGSTPVKLAFRTGIKHVAAKDARTEKRVVIVNAVEATEAPESRRVSHTSLFTLLYFCSDCLAPARTAPDLRLSRLHLGGSHRHPPHASGTPPPPFHTLTTLTRCPLHPFCLL